MRCKRPGAPLPTGRYVSNSPPMNRQLLPRFALLPCILLGCLFCGCTSPYPHKMQTVKNDIQKRGAFLNSTGGDTVKFPHYLEKDRLLEYQEKARYYQLIAQHPKALHFYQKAIEYYDQLDEKARLDLSDSARKSAATVVASDNVIPYTGSDLEKLLCFQNALISAALTSKEDDLNIAVRRMSELLSQYADPTNQKYREKLQRLNDANKTDFKKQVNSLQFETAFKNYRRDLSASTAQSATQHAPIQSGLKQLQTIRTALDAMPNPVLNAASCYLVGLFSEINRKDSDASRAYELAYHLAPHLGFIGSNILATDSGDDSATSMITNSKVVVLFEHSYVPAKYARQIFIPTLFGGSRAQLPDYNLEGIRHSLNHPISLQINDANKTNAISQQPLATTQRLCEIQLHVYRDFEDHKKAILTRFITRNIIKTAASTTASVAGLSMMSQDQNKNTQQLGLLFYLLGQILDASSVNADTRSWTLLPRTYELAQFDIPAGKYDLELRVCSPSQPNLQNTQPILLKNVVVPKAGYTFIYSSLIPGFHQAQWASFTSAE